MRRILCILLLVLLSGCAVKPQIDVNSVDPVQNLPQTWIIEGRMAFKTPDDKFSAAMEWQQDADTFNLRLSKLIGGTLLVLKQDNTGMVTLEFDGKVYRDFNAENLLWRVTGWSLPVKDFKHWVAGQINPHSNSPESIQRDDTGRLWSFATSDGWNVKYQNYKVFSGNALPHNLTISKQNTSKQDISLKLRISDWDFSQTQ